MLRIELSLFRLFIIMFSLLFKLTCDLDSDATPLPSVDISHAITRQLKQGKLESSSITSSLTTLKLDLLILSQLESERGSYPKSSIDLKKYL